MESPHSQTNRALVRLGLIVACVILVALVMLHLMGEFPPPSDTERHDRRVISAMGQLESIVYVRDCYTGICWAYVHVNGEMSPVNCEVLEERHMDVTWVNGC